MPFGLRNAPATFVKAIRKILFPIREHSDAYIDDTYTTSNPFSDRMQHLGAFLSVIKDAGLTFEFGQMQACSNYDKVCRTSGW